MDLVLGWALRKNSSPPRCQRTSQACCQEQFIQPQINRGVLQAQFPPYLITLSLSEFLQLIFVLCRFPRSHGSPSLPPRTATPNQKPHAGDTQPPRRALICLPAADVQVAVPSPEQRACARLAARSFPLEIPRF